MQVSLVMRIDVSYVNNVAVSVTKARLKTFRTCFFKLIFRVIPPLMSFAKLSKENNILF